MKTHIDTFTAFVAEQMDGQEIPPHNSPALARLSETIAGIQKGSDHDLEILALRIVGAVIARVGSGIETAQTLRTFIAGGDHA